MAKRRFTDEAERELIEAYRAGASTLQLAERYQTERITVARTLRRNGILIRGPQGHDARALSEQDHREILDRYERGEKVMQLARDFQTHYGRITLLLRQAGVYRGNKRNWQGGRSTTAKGYLLVQASPDDPIGLAMASTIGYVMEHRLVMAHSLGRALTPTETVHHINGDKKDNRLENLQLRTGRHGNGHIYECCDCGSRNVRAVELD